MGTAGRGRARHPRTPLRRRPPGSICRKNTSRGTPPPLAGAGRRGPGGPVRLTDRQNRYDCRQAPV